MLGVVMLNVVSAECHKSSMFNGIMLSVVMSWRPSRVGFSQPLEISDWPGQNLLQTNTLT